MSERRFLSLFHQKATTPAAALFFSKRSLTIAQAFGRRNLLQATGLTRDEWLTSNHDSAVLDYGVGLTDLVPDRAASSDAVLRSPDFDVKSFIEKIEHFTPRVVAFNGERAAMKVARYLNYPPPPEGPAPWTIGESLAYRLPSSSSANATGGYASKRAKWAEFGKWVAQKQRIGR